MPDAFRSRGLLLQPGSRWLAIAALVIAAFAGGCAKPQPPSVVPHVVRVAGVSVGGLELDVELQVHNPNSFPLAAEAVRGTLFVAREQKLGQGSSQSRTTIPGGATSLVESRVRIGWESLTALAPLLASERIPYVFRGDVTVGGKTINVTLPFTLEGELTRAQLLEAGWRGL
jgi:LEA14-like dessication related protein